MARNRGGVRSAPARRSAPAPAKVSRAPPPAPVQAGGGGGGMLSGIGSTIAQGFAFGTGSAVAHRAVDGIMGPRTVEHVNAPAATSEAASASPALSTVTADACGNQMKAFQDCISSNANDIGRCQFYLDMLSQCRSGPSAPVIL